MKARFWGTRGSVPAPGPQTVRYGGNTSCVEVRGDDGSLVVLDAGTGIRELGRALERDSGGPPPHIDLFITHAHWDHVHGIPFFAPLYADGASVSICGPELLPTPLESVLATMLAPGVFPVDVSALRARLEFPRIGREAVAAGSLRVSAFPALHPGGAVGFRVEPAGSPGQALIYLPDNEVRASTGPVAPDQWQREFAEFAAGAAVLVHDAMYTEDEYESHRGWGHSTVADAVRLAEECGIPKLTLFHHAPERDDDEVERLLDAAREDVHRRGIALEIQAAAEGSSVA